MPDEGASAKAEVVRDVAWYSAGTYVAQGLGIISGILIRRILGPTGMGIWSALMLFRTYASYGHLGIMQAAEREIPFFRGRQDPNKVERIQNTTHMAILAASLLAAVIIWVLSVLWTGQESQAVIYGLRLTSLVVVAQLQYSFYTTLARTAKRFGLLSKVIILSAVLNIAAILVLARPFGVYGMLLATTMVLGLSALYLRISLQSRPGLAFSAHEALRLLTIGLPLMVYGVVFSTLLNIDVIMTGTLLGATQLGIYSVATMVKTYAFSIPNIISMVMFPRFQERHGATGDPAALKNLFFIPTMVIATLGPVLIGAIYFAVHLVVYALLPEYMPGLASLRGLVLGVFFLAIATTPAQLLITLNKQVQLVLILLASTGVGWALIRLLVALDWGIVGVAIGTSAAYLLNATATLAYGASYYADRRGDTWRLLARVYAPFVYGTLMLFTVDWVVDWGLGTVSEPLTRAVVLILLKSILFGLLSLPLLWFADRQTGIIRALGATMKGWLGLLRDMIRVSS